MNFLRRIDRNQPDCFDDAAPQPETTPAKREITHITTDKLTTEEPQR
jgi:hypothetical protein